VDDLVEQQRTELRKSLDIGSCRASEEENEIVVCGARQRSQYRLPLPVEPTPGARTIGEAADARGLLALGETCQTRGQRPSSNKLDLLAVAITAVALAAEASGLVDLTPPPETNSC
jgi:hypothetical protein